MRALLALLCIALALAPAAADELARPSLAIVIDDIGWNATVGERALALPTAVTLAVLPATPVGEALARSASSQGREVILHQPMAALHPARLGPGALRADMAEAAFRARVAQNLDALPGLVGVSNHMGSMLTARSEQMHWLMDELEARGDLLFLDSRTTADTVAEATAQAHAIPALHRDVFLDVIIDPAAIERALAHAVRVARRQGSAVAIGHPHAATLAVLEDRLPELAAEVELVSLSQLVERQAGEKREAQAPPTALAAD